MLKPKAIWLLVLVFTLTGFMLAAGCGSEGDVEGPPEEAPVENGDEVEPGNAAGPGQDNGMAVENSSSAGNGPGSGNGTVPDCWNYQPTGMKPNPGWNTVDLEGLTREELVEVLGCPPHVIRMTSVVSAAHNRELWVYHPYDEDPTGLFVWLKGNVYHDSMLDEFNGFWCYEMSDLDFWE